MWQTHTAWEHMFLSSQAQSVQNCEGQLIAVVRNATANLNKKHTK